MIHGAQELLCHDFTYSPFFEREARGLLKKGKRATKLRPSYRAAYRRHSLMRLRSSLRDLLLRTVPLVLSRE